MTQNAVVAILFAGFAPALFKFAIARGAQCAALATEENLNQDNQDDLSDPDARVLLGVLQGLVKAGKTLTGIQPYRRSSVRPPTCATSPLPGS
jgi:hypothetical protein